MKNNKYTFIKKDWGSELWLANNKLYCSKMLNCEDNKWSSGGRYHYHKKKDETFIVLDGTIALDIQGKDIFILRKLESYRIKPNIRHRFKGYPEGIILEVSTHHEDSDSYRVKK